MNERTLNPIEFTKDFLKVNIFPKRDQLGKYAAENISDKINNLLQIQEEVRVIFAAAPSQNEFLDELSKIDLDWQKITAFHMDEYIGLDKNADQLFSKYLQKHIFSKVSFKKVHLIEPFNNPVAECNRYEVLLLEKPIDIVCMGIGENGHIAFNDPPVADFDDPVYVKIIELEETCRKQQVNDGCFVSLNEVPKSAITLTIPALMSAKHLCVVVPGMRKADAVYNSLYNKISPDIPASIIRKHPDAVLYLDYDSAERIMALS